MDKRGKAIKSAYIVLFMLYVVFLLAGMNGDYMRKTEGQSMFLPTAMFLADFMECPGGMLSWAGTFLTQFFYHPWLGAIVYSILAAMLVLMVGRAFKMPSWAFPLAVVPSAMALLTYLSLGYLIFTMRPNGIAFECLLGVMSSVALFWLWRLLPAAWLRVLGLIAVVVLGYVPMGFYALLGAAMCVVFEFSHAVKGGAGAWHRVLAGAAGAVAIAAWPWVYYYVFVSVLKRADLYTSGLPIFYDGEEALWIPLAVAFAFLLAMSFCASSWPETGARVQRAGRWLCPASYVAVLVVVFACRYDDENFSRTVSMQLALDECDWAKAAGIAAQQKSEPTRLNVLLGDIALMRLGQAGDKMFTYHIGAAPYNTTRSGLAIRDLGSQVVNWHFGRLNGAYRWAMEYKVEYGMRVDYLKMMAKCAILQGEYDLAAKCLDALEQTMFHKDWARKRQAMLHDPQLIDEDEEMRQIKPLTMFRDHLGGDGGKVESFILPMVSKLRGGTNELMEVALQCNLMLKDLDNFMPRFIPLAGRYEEVPVHYQEAVLLWSMLNQQQAYKMVKISPEVMERFNDFVRAQKICHDYPIEMAAESMRGAFGDTYWYYFFFIKGMKTS